MKELIGSITKKEIVFITVLSVIMSFIVIIPLIYGWMATPPGHTFTGVHFSIANDIFQYYSFIEQVRQGNFLLYDLFTSENHTPLFNPAWLSVGLIAKIFGFSSIVTFNLAKIILFPIFFWIAYIFISYIFSDINKKKSALLLLTFGSGVEIFFLSKVINFLVWGNSVSLLSWVETNAFLALYYSPHSIISLILILIVFFFTIVATEEKNWRFGFFSGTAALILFFFHPFQIIPIFFIISAYFALLIIKDKKIFNTLLKYYLALSAVSLPAIIYFYFLLKNDAAIIWKSANGLYPTPPFWVLLINYGLVLIFALLGIYFLLLKKRVSNKHLFLIVWLIGQFILIYFPLKVQFRFLHGIFFPMAMLAAVAIFEFCKKIDNPKNKIYSFLAGKKYFLLFVLVILLASSNVFQVLYDFVIYKYQKGITYITTDSVSAASWLKNVDKKKIILNVPNNYMTNLIPAYSGRKVYVGHEAETINYRKKIQDVVWFFEKNHPLEIEKDFLINNKIDYIYYSQAEKEIGDYNPEIKPYLQKIYNNDSVAIYQVLTN